MINSEEFSKRLQLVFDFYDLNASSFAEKIGVGRASISHILSGRNKPSLDFVMKVVNEFSEVELYWLLKGKGKFPKEDNLSSPISSFDAASQNEQNLQTDKHYKKSHINSPEEMTMSPTSQKGLQHSVKKIKKVLFFYTDGSFDEYIPNT